MNFHLCMIHGWAVNGAIFNDFKTLFPENWQISTPDLLGHGQNHDAFSVQAASVQIAAQLTEPAVLLGWSLGGLVALHLARDFPEKVRALVLCNTFARFQAAPDYPEGVNPAILQKMATFLQADYPHYLRQFLEMQLLNHPQANEILEQLLPNITQNGTPTALQSALKAVENADIRASLPHIHTPTLLLYGAKDRITPPRMGEYLAQHLPHASLHIAPHAAHAPFLSDADWCSAKIDHFLNEMKPV